MSVGSVSEPLSGSSCPGGDFAIIGAGIAGCSLALLLQKQGFRVTIFERELETSSRPQGYNLTIHQEREVWSDLGIDKLIEQQFIETTEYNTYTSSGELIVATFPPKVNHLGRPHLRSFIKDQLNPGTIRWGKQLVGYELDDVENPTKVRISFNDNTSYEYKALVGCDGFKSKVRELIDIEDSLNYLGVVILYATALDDNNFNVRRSQIVDGNIRLFFKPHSKTEVYWQLTFPFPRTEDFKARFPTQKSLLEEAIRLTQHWDKTFTNVFANTRTETIFANLLYDKTPVISYNKKLVTLAGDAAHPMAPFKGQGANSAMMDALLFSNTLKKFNVSTNDFSALPDAIHEYEIKMFNHASLKVTASRQMVAFFHHPDCLDREKVAQFIANSNMMSY